MESKALKLSLPAALAVTTFFALGACRPSDDDGDGDGGTDEGSNETYCEDIESMAVCASEPGCGWDTEYDSCQNTCFEIEDELECMSIDRCVWDTEGESGTGGGAFCHEPFT